MPQGRVVGPFSGADIVLVAVVGVRVVRRATHEGNTIWGEDSYMTTDGMGEVGH